ncbi:MAG: hypothetical protein QM758_08580 [Armatimonas sp.]
MRKDLRRSDVDTFEKLSGQMLSLHEEISLLSRKNPNDAVNKFKLKFINKLITESNLLLSDKYLPFTDFEAFDEDDIPQTSDIVLILSQYLQCFEKFRSDHITPDRGAWYWKVKGTPDDIAGKDGLVSIRTSAPKKLR